MADSLHDDDRFSTDGEYVTLAGVQIYRIDSDEGREFLRGRSSDEFTPELVRAMYRLQLERDCCPVCGEKQLHERVTVNGVSIGHCSNCLTDAYIHNGQWFTQVGNRSGYLRIEKR